MGVERQIPSDLEDEYERAAWLLEHTPDTIDNDWIMAARASAENTRIYIERIADLAAEVEALRSALKGLLHRHNDGSEEKYWAEWDTANEALATDQQLQPKGEQG